MLKLDILLMMPNTLEATLFRPIPFKVKNLILQFSKSETWKKIKLMLQYMIIFL